MKLHRIIALSIGVSWLAVDSGEAFADDTDTSSSVPSQAAPSSDAAPPSSAPSSLPAPLDASAAPRARKPIRFTATLGAISLPRLLSLELLARFRRSSDPAWDLFAVGAGIEYLPPIVHFGEKTTFSWFQVGPEGRYFIYRWLFAGARIGYQFARADSSKLGSEVDYVTTSAFVAPKVGALYTFTSGSLQGFTVGGDLGATIPVLPGTTRESDAQTDANARKVAKTFGMFVMPFFSLRVGWTI